MAIDEEQDDRYEYEQVLLESRHKEIKKTLESILAEVKKEKNDDAVIAAINKQGESITKLATAINNIPKPEIKFENNQDKLLASIKDMCKEVCDGYEKLLDALNKKPVPEAFDIIKNNWGNTTSIKVNYKK